MRLVIDRFEGGFAVCEDENRKMVNIETCKLPSDAREGDVLRVQGDEIKIDLEETEVRKLKINELTKDLWE